jgi:hypothetical protein
MSFTSAPKGYAWSNVSMRTFLDTPQNDDSIKGYSVVEKNLMSGWKGPVYPINFSINGPESTDENGNKVKMISAATVNDSSLTPKELKSKYYLLIKGQGTVTYGGKSRRRRQTKNKRKSRRTRRSRKTM